MTTSLRSRLLESFGVSEAQLNRLIARAPHTYKIYTIPKRTGGLRTIAQPAKETKYLQYWLMENYFSKLPIHTSAMAYQKESSIKRNADAHKDNPYLAKFDFRSFFTSIKHLDLSNHFRSHLGKKLLDEEIADIARISCISQPGTVGLCLSIGAPSSPILSNSIMYEFDNGVAEWCAPRSITYTRYADDLCFSTSEKGITSSIEPVIRLIAKQLTYPRLQFNSEKTTLVSMKFQRRITGLILDNTGNVSLGRERKRLVSAMIYRALNRQLSDEELLKLKGLLAFALDAEASFVDRMRLKYGSETINAIFDCRQANTRES
jgi:RNA-directed DNA polymerase